MNRAILISILLLLPALQISAMASERGLAECSKIQSNEERLNCFDELADAVAPDNDQGDLGSWDVSVDTNPMDDTRTVTLLLRAESGNSAYGDPIYLLVRCMSNETEFFIAWDDYLGREAVVTTRIGDSAAVTAPWSLSTDNSATFHRNPITILKEMMTANRFVARVTPYNESPTTAVFDTTGMSEAIKPLREICNW